MESWGSWGPGNGRTRLSFVRELFTLAMMQARPGRGAWTLAPKAALRYLHEPSLVVLRVELRRPTAARAVFLPVAGLVGLVRDGAADPAPPQASAVLPGGIRLVGAHVMRPRARPARPKTRDTDLVQDALPPELTDAVRPCRVQPLGLGFVQLVGQIKYSLEGVLAGALCTPRSVSVRAQTWVMCPLAWHQARPVVVSGGPRPGDVCRGVRTLDRRLRVEALCSGGGSVCPTFSHRPRRCSRRRCSGLARSADPVVDKARAARVRARGEALSSSHEMAP